MFYLPYPYNVIALVVFLILIGIIIAQSDDPTFEE